MNGLLKAEKKINNSLVAWIIFSGKAEEFLFAQRN
jgi:hypothetical protein